MLFTFCHKGDVICLLQVIDISPSSLLIPACASSSPAFHMMYSAYKLHKQSDNIQRSHTPFPVLNSLNYCFLICIQISQVAGKEVCYSHLFKNFPQLVVIHTVKGFNVVDEADVFLEFSCFFHDPADVGNLISGSSAFSKSSLNIRESRFTYC